MSLHNRKRQIVVTSSALPQEARGLAPGLKAFFSQGQMVEIGVPDLETRAAILKSKAQENSLELSEEAVHLVASRVDNIRSMEGCLLRLVHASSLTGELIDQEFAERTLREIFGRIR